MISLVFGAMLIAWAPIFVAFLERDPGWIALYRCGIAAVILLILAPGTLRLLKNKKIAWVAAATGLAFALDLVFWHISVHKIGAGLSTILASTQVFHALWLSMLFERVRPKLFYLLSLFLAFVGVVLLLGRTGELDSDFLQGLFFGLLAGFCYAVFITLLKSLQYRASGHRPVQRLALVLFFTSALLLPVSLIEAPLALPQGGEWWWVLGLALVVQVFAWILIQKGLKECSLSMASLILLLQPVLAAFLGYSLMDERLTWLQIIGAGLTLVAIYLASLSRPNAAR